MLLPQTHSPAVDYSLYHGAGGDVDGEGGDLSGRAPPEFSPSDLQPPDLCFLVSLVWRPSSGKTSGDLLYSRF